ncbi:MAG TPA: hypothetical protein VF384_05260 [Planctomycetota bacterium]
MSAAPRSLTVRVGLAVLAAALGITALQFCVVRCESEAAPKPAPLPAPPRAAGTALRLLPAAGTILLATRLQAVPPDVAPVVQILADGSTALRRPAPLSTGPLAVPVTSRDGHGAAVLLPTGTLPGLTASARGALVEVLGQLVAERPVPERRFVAGDFPLAAADLANLLRWVP